MLRRMKAKQRAGRHERFVGCMCGRQLVLVSWQPLQTEEEEEEEAGWGAGLDRAQLQCAPEREREWASQGRREGWCERASVFGSWSLQERQTGNWEEGRGAPGMHCSHWHLWLDQGSVGIGPDSHRFLSGRQQSGRSAAAAAAAAGWILIMGCSASAVLLLRSVGGADCGHMCSRQDRVSLDVATPALEGYTATSSPLTIIVMVTEQPKL